MHSDASVGLDSGHCVILSGSVLVEMCHDRLPQSHHKNTSSAKAVSYLQRCGRNFGRGFHRYRHRWLPGITKLRVLLGFRPERSALSFTGIAYVVMRKQ